MRHHSVQRLYGLILLAVFLQHLPTGSTQSPPAPSAGRPRPPLRPPPPGAATGPEGPARRGSALPPGEGAGPPGPESQEDHGDDRDGGEQEERDMGRVQRPGEPGSEPGSEPGTYAGVGRPPIAAAPGPANGGGDDGPMSGPERPGNGKREEGMGPAGPSPPPLRDCEDRMGGRPRNSARRPPPRRPRRRPMGGMYGSRWEYEMWRDYWDQWYDDQDRDYYGWPPEDRRRDDDGQDCDDRGSRDQEENGNGRMNPMRNGGEMEEYEDDDGQNDNRLDNDRDGDDRRMGEDEDERNMDMDRDQDDCDDERPIRRPNARRVGMYDDWDDMDDYNMYSYYNMGPMMPLCPCMGRPPMMPPRYLPPRRRGACRPPGPVLCEVVSVDTGDELVNRTCRHGYVCVRTNQTTCSNVTISICIHQNCTNMTRCETKECMRRKAEEEARKKARGMDRDFDKRRGCRDRDMGGYRGYRNNGGESGYSSGRGSGRGRERGNGGERGGGGEGGSVRDRDGRRREADGDGEREEIGSGGDMDTDQESGSEEETREREGDHMRMGDGERMKGKMSKEMEGRIKKYLKCLGPMGG